MKSLQRVITALLSVCAATTVAAEPPQGLTITAAGGELLAARADGAVVWKVRFADSDPRSWQPQAGGGVVLDNGVAIDEAGRVFARWHDLQGGGGSRRGDERNGTCPYWSALAEIAPAPGSGVSDHHKTPLFDSQGNAWVVMTHIESGDYSLRVRRSNGHHGTWQPLETISDSTTYVSGPEGAIDPADNITVTFRDISGGYKLYSMRYEPGVGWAGPNLVYTTPNFFQAIETGADYEGNVATVFDPDVPYESVWSTVYDAATGTWGPAQQVSPAGYGTLLPTAVQNRAGDAVYLIYMVQSGGPTGLYAHRFDSKSKAWGPPELLPGTSTVTFSGAGPESRFPATVDLFGEATVFWQSSTQSVYASRTQEGTWQSAYEVLDPAVLSTDLANFAHAEASEFGDAFGVITNYEAGNNRFYAFRYRAGVGWEEPDNPYTSTLNISTRVRIAAYRGAIAVATLYGWQNGTDQLTSLLYDGTDWLPGLLDIPGDYPAFFQELEADQGEPLLVFEPEEVFGPSYGIWASWLRNLPGDLDGDGDVELDDLAMLLASYGLDDGGDVDGDGDTDLSDLAALLANYGEVCP
jgi:hypothetical protein